MDQNTDRKTAFVGMMMDDDRWMVRDLWYVLVKMTWYERKSLRALKSFNTLACSRML